MRKWRQSSLAIKVIGEAGLEIGSKKKAPCWLLALPHGKQGFGNVICEQTCLHRQMHLFVLL